VLGKWAMALKLGWKVDVLRGAQAPPPPPGPLPAAQVPPLTSQLSEGLIETFAALSVGTTPATVITSTSVAASTVTAGLRYFTTASPRSSAKYHKKQGCSGATMERMGDGAQSALQPCSCCCPPE
jgi:hypothetical protein